MHLNSNQINQVINYLKKFPTPVCILCGHDDWKVSEDIFAMSPYQPTQAAAYGLDRIGLWGPHVFPVVPLVCSTCGNVLLLSAVAAGVAK